MFGATQILCQVPLIPGGAKAVVRDERASEPDGFYKLECVEGWVRGGKCWVELGGVCSQKRNVVFTTTSLTDGDAGSRCAGAG